MLRTLIVGYGNMGKAITKGLLNSLNGHAKDKIIAISREPSINDIPVVVYNYEFIKQFNPELIIFTIKPQLTKEILPLYKDLNCLYVSCMAGIKMETLENYLGEKQIIRAIPNICVQVNRGFIGYEINDNVTNKNIKRWKDIVGILGCGADIDAEGQSWILKDDIKIRRYIDHYTNNPTSWGI